MVIMNTLVMSSFLAGSTLLGVCVGSFLNVVIFRLPLLISYSEQTEAQDSIQVNLYLPRSFCIVCKKTLPKRLIIPVFSFLALGGISRCCRQKIPFDYLLVEILTGVLTLLLAIQLGPCLKFIYGLVLLWSLIALAFIDWKTFLLPDQITLPLLWLGLLCNINGMFAPLSQAVLGAISGYSFFYLLSKLVFKIKKIEGLGRGDVKFLAVIGAWFGWQSLPVVTFIASLTGALYAACYLAYTRQKSTTHIPFGPFLAFSAIICLFGGNNIIYSPFLCIV